MAIGCAIRSRAEHVQAEAGLRCAVSGGWQPLLVERLWPRGVTKERAALDLWLKDIAPSPELRKWFGHDPAKWPAFRQRYAKELERHEELVSMLRKKGRKGMVTLVYAARDEEHNSATILRSFLTKGKG